MTKRKKQKTSKKDWTDTRKTPLNNPFAALAKRRSDFPDTEPPQPLAIDAPAPNTAPPARAVVRIQRKGRGGKTATAISHLALPGEELKAWLKAMRKQLGCSGQVEGDLIILGGDQRDRACQWLERRGVRKITRS